MTGSDGIWKEVEHSFWQIKMRSQQRHYSANSAGTPAPDRTEGFQKHHQRAGAAAGAAADAAAGPAVGGSAAAPAQGP